MNYVSSKPGWSVVRVCLVVLVVVGVVSGCYLGDPGRGLGFENMCDTEITVATRETSLGSVFPRRFVDPTAISPGENFSWGYTTTEDFGLVVVGSGYRVEFRFGTDYPSDQEHVDVFIGGEACP